MRPSPVRPMRPLVALGAVVLGSCSMFATPELGLTNDTDLDLTLVVNGEAVAEYEAQSGDGPSIPFAELPPPPWTIEVLSESRRVVAFAEVRAEDVRRASEVRADFFRGVLRDVQLSCGRLVIWATEVAPPLDGPPAGGDGAGQPGDCEP